MARIALLLSVFFFAAMAQAQVGFSSYNWKASGDFVLKVVANGEPMVIKGNLRYDASAIATEAPVVVKLKSFSDTHVLIAVSGVDDERGYGFILERQNSQYLAMNETPIEGRPGSIFADLEGAIAKLGEQRHWSMAQSSRAITEWFANNPDRMAHDFYNEVEAGYIRKVPGISTDDDGGNGIQRPQVDVAEGDMSITGEEGVADDVDQSSDQQQEPWQQPVVQQEQPRRKKRPVQQREDDIWNNDFFAEEQQQKPRRKKVQSQRQEQWQQPQQQQRRKRKGIFEGWFENDRDDQPQAPPKKKKRPAVKAAAPEAQPQAKPRKKKRIINNGKPELYNEWFGD